MLNLGILLILIESTSCQRNGWYIKVSCPLLLHNLFFSVLIFTHFILTLEFTPCYMIFSRSHFVLLYYDSHRLYAFIQKPGLNGIHHENPALICLFLFRGCHRNTQHPPLPHREPSNLNLKSQTCSIPNSIPANSAV